MENFQEIHIEKDFWDDFIVEAFEHIDEIESNAMSLEQNPEDMDIIHTMFRAFHTIKGLSGFVEHTIIQEVAHKTETLMDYCRKGELAVNTKIVDAILKSSDYIKRLCEDVEAYKEEALLEQIQTLLCVLEELAVVSPQDTPPVEEEVSVEIPFEAEPLTEVVPFEETTPTHIEEVSEEPKTDSPIDAFIQSYANSVDVPKEELSEEAVADVVAETAAEAEVSADDKGEPVEIPIEEVQFEESIDVKEEDIKDEGLKAFFEEAMEAITPEEELPVEIEAIANPEDIVQQEVVQAQEELSEGKLEVEAPAEKSAEIVFEVASVSKNVEENKVEEKIKVPPTAEQVALSSFQKNVVQKLQGGGSTTVKTETAKDAPAKSSANEEYMKVANYKIDHLVDMIGELIINQSLIEQYVAVTYSEDKQLTTNMSGFLRITRELQNLSMSLRMVSLRPTFQKLTRIARDTIQELSKNVEFVTSGESTEIDRVVTEKLLDPLVHLIKNAISHGCEENQQDRIDAGKNPRARVELNAYSKRGKIFIEIKDDGRGINTEIVYNKALEKGLVDPARTYSDAEIREFILLPGFSTAKVVDNISGRGVGMDVVKTQILKIGGKVDIQSELGKGSTFTLEVPVNHAIMNGTIIEMNEQHFVVPTINVKEFLQPSDNQWIFTQQERTMIKVRDNIIPIIPHSVFFKGVKTADHVPLVMILEMDQELKALPITNVFNRQEVVVKPVGEEFQSLKYISGMSILGTGKVSLILDIDYLFKKEVKE